MYTPERWLVFNSGYLGTVMIGSSQFLYLLTLSLSHLPKRIDFKYLDDSRIAWSLLTSAVIVSFFINRTSFYLSGAYTGNVNAYWSGLPAIFVTLMSAWLLLNRSAGLTFFVCLNGVVSYWSLAGNRSEILMIFLYGNVAFAFASPAFKTTKSRSVALGLVLLLGFVIFTLVGIIRAEGNISQSPLTSVFAEIVSNDRLNVSTVGSSVYSGLVAFDVSMKQGLYYGTTFLGQFLNIIPSFINTPWVRYENPYFTYGSIYQTMGGFGIIGESFLNFGILGPPIFGILFAWGTRFLALRSPRSFLCSWVLLALTLYSQRFFYYGYVYLHNIIVLFAVIGLLSFTMRRYSRSRHISRC